VASRRTADGRPETEWGVVYLKANGKWDAIYNVFVVRDAQQRVLAKGALKRDADVSDLRESTRAPPARATQCGYARFRTAGGS